MTTLEALQLAIAILGSQQLLAEAIGTTQPNISRWLKAKKVPAEYVLPIEAATSGRVTRHVLRPDLYPLEAAV